jgi:hypothetical protein
MTLAGFAKRQQRGQKGTGRKRFGLSYICLAGDGLRALKWPKSAPFVTIRRPGIA